MAVALPVARQHAGNLGADRRRRRVEDGRVEVALQRNAGTDQAARLGKVGRPVDAERVGAGPGQRGEGAGAGALREEHQRHLPAVGLAVHGRGVSLHIGE